ncbi:hypothetical protein CLU79DRAFT_703545 [Phycomyces nitens]|nr:hypothetical protein CLU79DRAFT_703545 [Phycomyces nitens]
MENIIPINEQEYDQQTTLTRAQVEELFRELDEQRTREKERQSSGTKLPLAISEALCGIHTTVE